MAEGVEYEAQTVSGSSDYFTYGGYTAWFLADLDPSQIVTPPKGFEIGYVPIATRQELAR